MNARPARHLDLLAIRGLAADGRNAIIPPSALDEPPGALQVALMPGRDRTWVVHDGRGFAGFCQAGPRKYVLGWEISRLYTRSDVDPEQATAGLVQAVLEHLQERGIPRLFARTPLESRGHDVLARCAFTHLLSECVLVREPGQVQPPDEMPSGMRYRMPSDAWPLHQLESDITPALVRQLEGLTSLAWSMKPQRRWQRDELSELVVERDGTIVGWAGWRERLHQGYIRLGLLAQSDDRDMASALVAHALLAIHAAYPQARVVVRLRDYQMGLHSALLDHNFRELGREALHIKHGRLQLVPKKVSRLFEIALDPLAGAPRPFSRGVPVYPGQK